MVVVAATLFTPGTYELKGGPWTTELTLGDKVQSWQEPMALGRGMLLALDSDQGTCLPVGCPWAGRVCAGRMGGGACGLA